MPIPETSEDKIFYKYIVDSEWLVSPTQRVAKDAGGIDNNILEPQDVFVADSGVATGSKIPEAGGLLAASAVTGVAAATSSKDVKTTVMPSTELQQQSVSGELGVFIPKDPEALAAFNEVSTVDPKSLNTADVKAMDAEEKKKQKKKVKRSQYKAKKKKKAAESAAVGLTPTETTTEGEYSDSPVPVDGQTKEIVAETETDKKVDQELAEGTAIAAGAVAAAGTVAASTAATSEVPDPAAVQAAEIATETAEPVGVTESKTLDPNAELEIPQPTVETPVDEVIIADVPVIETAVTEAVVAEAPIEKEVDAAPVTKAVDPQHEEIIIAHGDGKDIAAAIAAQEGDVTVEEIKPTESEAARLTEEARVQNQSSPSKQPSTKKATKTEKKEKKPNFLVRLFRKLK